LLLLRRRAIDVGDYYADAFLIRYVSDDIFIYSLPMTRCQRLRLCCCHADYLRHLRHYTLRHADAPLRRQRDILLFIDAMLFRHYLCHAVVMPLAFFHMIIDDATTHARHYATLL